MTRFGERGGRGGECCDVLAGVCQVGKKFGLYPVGGGLAGSAGFDSSFEIIGEGLCAGENFGGVGRYAIGGDEAGALGFGEFGKRAANFFAPSGADVDREKIGLREIAVVVGLFF